MDAHLIGVSGSMAYSVFVMYKSLELWVSHAVYDMGCGSSSSAKVEQRRRPARRSRHGGTISRSKSEVEIVNELFQAVAEGERRKHGSSPVVKLTPTRSVKKLLDDDMLRQLSNKNIEVPGA